MEIKDQVTNLELSKRLKELGVEQKSLFYWIKAVYVKGNEEWQLWSKWEIEFEGPEFGTLEEQQDYAPAFTVAELGAMLPYGVWSEKNNVTLFLTQFKDENKFYLKYEDADGDNVSQLFLYETEADARGAMLIYLLENKLVTL